MTQGEKISMKTLKFLRPRKRGSNDLNFPGSLNLRGKRGEMDRRTGKERLSKAERHGMAFANVCKIRFEKKLTANKLIPTTIAFFLKKTRWRRVNFYI